MKATELNGTHLGKPVTATIGRAIITDVLIGVEHDADLIRDNLFAAEYPSWVIGRNHVTLEFQRAGHVIADEHAIVEFQTDASPATDVPQFGGKA